MGFENLENIKSPIIFAFFHGRMLMLPPVYRRLRKGKKMKMIQSPHFDGVFAAKIASKFGVESIEGSSSKGSLSLLKALARVKDYDIGITPDGPRGPGYKVKSGVVYISKITNLPVIPASYGVKKFKQANSWDKFMLPYPFTKGVYVCGKPVYIPSDISKEDFSHWAEKLEKELLDVTALADKLAAEG